MALQSQFPNSCLYKIPFMLHFKFSIIFFFYSCVFQLQDKFTNFNLQFTQSPVLNHRVLWLYDTWCYHTNLIPIQLLHSQIEIHHSQLSLYLFHAFCCLIKLKYNFHSSYINTYSTKLPLLNKGELWLHVLVMISHYQVKSRYFLISNILNLTHSSLQYTE